jgi:hypothetical protein
LWTRWRIDNQNESFIIQARSAFLSAEKYSPGQAAYYLACISALMHQENDCQSWLAVGKKTHKLPEKDYIEKDPDLESVRNKPWFIQFLKDIQ